MTLYLDSSALIKRYVLESETPELERTMGADPDWVTARHTLVEVRRNLARALRPSDRKQQQRNFAADFARMDVVDLDTTIFVAAAEIAELTGARTLDALHLAAARRAGGAALTFVTYDVKLAQAARSLGLRVQGV